MSSTKMTEADIAAGGMSHLKKIGWDCYPEAQFEFGGNRADIAALKDGKLIIWEAKTSLTMRLLNQANNWVNMRIADQVCILIPLGIARQILPLTHEICRWKGIGIMQYDPKIDQVYPHRQPKDLNPIPEEKAAIIEKLHPDMKNYSPGSTADNGFSTPYNRTMGRIRDYLSNHPDAGLSDILDEVPHHYASKASARCSIPRAIRRFESDKIKITSAKGRLVFNLTNS